MARTRDCSQVSQVFQQDFEARSSTAMEETPEWLEKLRREGMERFSLTGFPTSRDEEWRFTPVSPISRTSWRPAPPGLIEPESLGQFLFGHPEWNRLVFVNGLYREDLSSLAPQPGI